MKIVEQYGKAAAARVKKYVEEMVAAVRKRKEKNLPRAKSLRQFFMKRVQIFYKGCCSKWYCRLTFAIILNYDISQIKLVRRLQNCSKVKVNSR